MPLGGEIIIRSKRVIKTEDLETQIFEFSMIKWLSAEWLSFGISLLAPGGKHERHSHPDAEEILYVLSGEGEVIFYPEGEKHTISPGTLIDIPPGKEHATMATSWEPLKMIIVCVPHGPERKLRESPECTVLPPGEIPKYKYK